MFTGIVEELGSVLAIDDLADSVRMTISGPVVCQGTRSGDSIAVNGCCLTVVGDPEDSFSVDVMQESLDRTSLSGMQVGDRVNLERAVTPSTRLGGHIVQGHVDATGKILERVPSENWEVVRISVPDGISRYLVPKGSITVDGVSLTLVEVNATDFTISLIPETLSRTTLGFKQVGDLVNLEVDVIAKYVEKLVVR
ncbi:MAG TPA: riboflavin synthase [Marmoricola sp.]|nr:riboflavin synthase [Marmoricola sp.]HNI69826.1 riboflavin synthase [Marmoricola sp.]HNJ78013.1 riboflavin synthase [Marmoricola sp.]